MERVLKRGSLVFVVALFAFVLLVSSFETANAGDVANEQNTRETVPSDNQTGSSPSDQAILPSTNKTGLSDFLIKLCEYQSRGNASVLARLEREWIHQEKINQAINHENPPQSPVG